MKKLLYSLFLAGSLLLLFFGCEKGNRKESVASGDPFIMGQEIIAAKRWLNTQEALLKGSAKVSFDSTMAMVDWADAVAMPGRDGDGLMMVGYRGSVSGDASVQFVKLVFFMTADLVPRLAGFAEVSPVDHSQGLDPYALVRNVYFGHGNGFSGKFSFYTLNKRLSFQLSYKSGTLASYGTVRPLLAGSTVRQKEELSQHTTPNTIGGGQDCTDWYLTITYYFDDGSSYSADPEYLYTTCGPDNEKSFNPDPGGGDGNSVEDDLVQVDSVRDSLTSPCLDSALNTISNSQVKNFITDMFQTCFSGFGAGINVSIVESDTMGTLPSGSFTSPISTNWTIELNSAFSYATQQYVAGLIIHELQHCYATYYLSKNPSAINLTTQFGQHEWMMKNYTGSAISLLENMFGMTADQATAVALSGYGDLWENATDSLYMINTFGVSASTQDDIMSQYLMGTLGTKCH